MRKERENVSGRGNAVVGSENAKNSVRENGEKERGKKKNASWRQSVKGNVNVRGRGKKRGKGKEGKKRGESWRDENWNGNENVFFTSSVSKIATKLYLETGHPFEMELPQMVME